MKKQFGSLLALALMAGALASGEVVVLRGGARMAIKGPILRQGETVLLTRPDGTLFSVPASEVDFKATAAVNAAAPAQRASSFAVPPPETPAGAARASREGPKAKIRVTDSDVGHQMDPTASRGPEAKGVATAATLGRAELVDYNQQKTGDQLLVRGNLRNPGSTPVASVRLIVSALDENGHPVSSAQATVAGQTIEPGRTVAFSATLAVGQTPVPILRFAPQWTSSAPLPPPEAPSASREQAAPAEPAATPAKQSPAPAPTPYGRGLLYAPPPASAPSVPPADGKTGYIPGASSPENQPKTPQ